jgi:hypothetical protein
MDQELKTLESQVGLLLANIHRLIEDRQHLLAQLAQAEATNIELRERIAEARSKVSLALSRLPGEGQFIGGEPSSGSDGRSPRVVDGQAAAAA